MRTISQGHFDSDLAPDDAVERIGQRLSVVDELRYHLGLVPNDVVTGFTFLGWVLAVARPKAAVPMLTGSLRFHGRVLPRAGGSIFRWRIRRSFWPPGKTYEPLEIALLQNWLESVRDDLSR